MKKIDIIIPTRNRLRCLRTMLNSIPDVDFISVRVMSDGDLNTYGNLVHNMTRRNYFRVVLTGDHKGSVYCRNFLTHSVEDGVICAMDNMVFHPGAIERALSIFNKNFPDDDGVLGFRFDDIGSCTALALVGQKFLRRYPNKKLFYPGYFHLACQEISALCEKLESIHKKKFLVVDDMVTVSHYKILDQTYDDARKFKKEDLRLKRQRERKGLVWGFDNDA